MLRVRVRVRVRLASTLAVGVLALAPLACAPDGAPTAPDFRSASSASFSKADDAAFDVDGDGRLSDEEKRAKEAADRAAKDAERAARDAEKKSFEALRDQWRAYKDSVKQGLVEAEFVRCEPQPQQAAARRIGPKGGEIKVGPHKLVIPPGALASEVEITAVAPTNSRRELEFYPHGLEFREPVRMTISYDRCIVPDEGRLEVVYTGIGNKIVARQPTLDVKDLKSVEAWTDHFSGYAVAWGRSGQAQE